MINTDRIVPVTAIDLISLYGLILKQDTTNNSGLVALQATNPGEFTQATNSAVALAAEPLKSLNFASTATAGTVYFVPSYDYVGFSINGTPETPAEGSATVEADGRTLYKAVLSSGDITITKVGF